LKGGRGVDINNKILLFLEVRLNWHKAYKSQDLQQVNLEISFLLLNLRIDDTKPFSRVIYNKYSTLNSNIKNNYKIGE
ncbi:MAG TPA: hypothetical protein P5556_11145, partial [Candidatus Gastranaerophilales bacterium]|nr:hypothetical protein [Candidatus Gastranaerophilales bacterium]